MNHEFKLSRSKLRRNTLFAIPLFYSAIMFFCVSSTIFPIDDPQEFRFVAEADSFLSLLGADVFRLFRPIKNLLFLLFSFVAPFGIRWCYMACILIGALSFFPVRGLCRRILGTDDKAILAASVWLFAPTLVSSAAWLSAVNILVMVSFASCAMVLHDSAWENNQRINSRILLAGLCLFLSLLSYECAIATVPLLFLFDLYLRPRRVWKKKSLQAYALYLSLAVLYLVLRHACSAKTGSSGLYFIETTRVQTIVSSPWFYIQHLLLWFWPFNRLFILGSYRWGDVPAWKLAVCCIVLFGAVSWCLLKPQKNSVSKFCLLFFLVGFAPTSNCLGLGNGPFGDYYMGLASIGLSALVANLVLPLNKQAGKWRIPSAVIATTLIATRLWAVAETASWASAWRSGTEVVSASVRNHPEFFSNKALLAMSVFGKDHYDEALRLCQEVEDAVGPNSRHMATVFALRGTYEMEVNHNEEEAFRLFDEMLRVDSSEESRRKWHFCRGRVFEFLQKDTAAARREYEAAVTIKDPHLDAAHRLALVEARCGNRDKAIALWKRILRLKPDDETALWHLAMEFRANGDTKQSERMEARAMKIGGR